MTYAFGIYFEDDDSLGLVAAGSRWTSGGNSAAARRARVAMQRRDRFGRWAEMGGGIAFPGRNSDGKIVKMVGRYVGPAEREGYMRVYVTEGRGIRAGIYEVPCKVATVAKALLKEKDLKEAGVNLDVNGQQVGDVLDRDIEFIAGMFKGDPSEFELDMARANVTKTEKKVIEKARLKAPAHKSYNIVNEKGVRIDKDEEPATSDVKKPSKKAKPAEVFPLPDLDKEIAEENPEKWAKLSEEEQKAKLKKERSRREWYVDANGKRIPANKLTDADKTPENLRIRDLKNHRVLDGNGKIVEFKPEYKPEANPIPQGEFKPVVEPDDGFWNANRVKPEEVKKDLTDPQAVYEELYNGGFVEVSPELALAAVKVAKEDMKYLGRDENPLFQSNPTDPRFREIANILASLPSAQETRLKRAINLSLMSEEKIDALKAYLDSNIEEGIGLSPESMKELHRKFRNLGVDITNMRITGQDAFSNDNLGAERINMPQLDAADQSDFLAYCDALGVNYKDAIATPEQLHPIQAEMDMGDVGNIMASWLDPAKRAQYGMDDQYLFVTRDGYVLDGHHRWSSALLAQMQSGEQINLKVMVLDMDHEDALKFVNEYNDHVGITRQMVGGKNVAEVRPDAPDVAELLVPAGQRAQIPNGQLVMNRAPSGPDGTPLEDWLKSHLGDKGDEIIPLFDDRLTEDKTSPDPEHEGAKIPGSRTMVTNLIAFRNSLREALKGAALDNNSEEFAFKYAIAQRVANMLNQIHSNLSNGLDYKTDTEFAGSTEDPKLRLAQARILPSTMQTSIDNWGKERIDKFDAVVIAKNGEPFLLKFSNGEVNNYYINPDGSIGDRAGNLTVYNTQEMEVRPDGTSVPRKASVYSAFQTDNRTKAIGLMTSSVLLVRWVQHKYGSYLGHSNNLRPNGNFYSKKVSRNMKWAHRGQADKNVHMQNPKADIFKVLTSMGLISGEYIPEDRDAPTESPNGWGANAGGTGWLKRLTIINNGGGADNYSVLNKRHETVENIVNSFYDDFKRKSAEEKQQILEQIPDVFKKFFSEKGNPTDDFDVQYKLLGTAYKDGMSKDETIAFLGSIQDGVSTLCRIFGKPEDTYQRELRPIAELKSGVEAHTWTPENNMATQPVFETSWLRNIEEPFSGRFKFQEWKMPNGNSPIYNGLPFASGARPAGAPDNWNDSPSALKDRFTVEELFAVLRESIASEKGKVAHIPEKDGASGYDVNPNAVYKALENHGVDSEMMLAEIYDEVNGNSENVDAINAARADNGNLNDILSKLRKEIGELDEPTAFDQIGGSFDNGILKADLIKRQEENVGGDAALNFQPLKSNEKYLDWENGRERIQAGAYVPQIPNRDFYISGVTDNPKLIARNFSPMGLKNALISAIENRMNVVKLEFANGSTRDVPLAAIRDALQYQGIDINTDLDNHPALKRAPKNPQPLGEVIEDNGPLRKRINFYSFGEGQPADAPHLYEEQVKDRDSAELESYDLGIADNSTDRNGKIKIAKIVKNADGKFEVWVASRSDNRTEDFSGEPMAVYDNWKNAYYDIGEFIKKDMNLAKATERLHSDRLPPVGPTRDFSPSLPVIDDANPDDVTLNNGIVVSRPDENSRVQIFNQPSSGNRIPGANNGQEQAAEAYTSTSNITANPGEVMERFQKHTIERGEDGQPVQKNTDIYTITSLGDLKYRVTVSHPETGATESYDFGDSMQARTFAKAYYQTMTNNPAIFAGWNTRRDNQNLINGVVGTIGEQQESEDSNSVTKVSQVTLRGGIMANVEVTIKKGVHPAWRRDAAFAENNYKYAEVRVTNPTDPDDVYLTMRVSRNGVRSWKIDSATGLKSALYNLGTFGGFRNLITENDKDAIARRLKEILHSLGGENNDKKLAPEVPVVDAPGGRAPAQAVEAPGRGQNKFSPENFANFVAERSQPIDVTGHTDNGHMGDGINGARKITLPDGRVFKYKRESQEKARQESLNHALYAVAGVQATEGKLGDDNGVIVLADAFQPVIKGSWRKAFTNRNYGTPKYAQAIADFHEGVPLDILMHQWDLRHNEGNAFIVPDENGVLRGMRCDAGSGGLFAAAGTSRHGPGRYFHANAKDMIIEHLGDIMRNGVSKQFGEEGRLYRGLTKDAFIASTRRTVLPLTDDKIDALVSAIIADPQDRADLAAGLKRRRLELLNYLGIDPNEEPPTGEQAVAPVNIPGNTPGGDGGLEANGFAYVGSASDGRTGVQIKGTLRPDGIFVANNWSALPEEVRKGIDSGAIVPTNLPFLSESVPSDGLPTDAQGNYIGSLPTFVDSEGVVRQGPYGATSVMVRKRMADGTYKYLYVTPKNADPMAKRMWSGKYAPLHQPKMALDQPFATPQELMMSHLGVSVEPISVIPVVMGIPGSPGVHRILIADIGDQDLDTNTAERSGLIGGAVWREVTRLTEAPNGTYWNQFGRSNIDIVSAVRNAENIVIASPSNQHDEEPSDAEAGNGGNGPSNPDLPQAGGPSGPRDSDGYRPLSVKNPIGPDGQRILAESVEVGDYADGSLKVKNQAGLVLGRVQPTYHGHWVATYMPNDITGRGGNNRNGDAVKAIFADKAQAEFWLSHKIGDFYGTPADGRRTMITDRPLGPNRPVAKFEVKKGFLNETTQDQRGLADRLIEQKVATSEERALYRAILSQDKLTVGEVGWVIGQLREKEDRSADEIEASRQAREDAVTSTPIAPSVMDNPNAIQATRVVHAGNLVVGDKILGVVNARVVFTAPGDNNTINVGVVGDNGKLRVYKVGQNSVIAIDNRGPVDPAEGNQNASVIHPVIAERRQTARLIQDRIKANYPNARELPNGDLIVGQRDYRQADGRLFRYEAVVHKLKSDEFVSYVRKQQIDENGNPVGNGTAAYFTQPGHSPKSVLGRLSRIVVPALSKRNPANGFNQRDDQTAEIINPATGLPIPSNLANADAQFIGDTGIEKTGNAAKDALISYVKTLVARGMAQPDIINQVLGGNQNLFSPQQMDDIIERLEWNRQFPGVNAIPYVSKDNKTIVRVGDKVTHYDAFGNPILMANGQPRTGVVTERRPYTMNRKPNGEYEYTDQLYVKWDNASRPTQVAARRVEVNRRGDGSAPVPAVQGPGNADPNVENRIAPMPFPVNRNNVVDPAADADMDNFTGPNGAVYGIDRGLNMTRFNKPNGQLDNIFVHNRNQTWEVRLQNPDGSTSLLGSNPDRGAAEMIAKQKIRERDSRPAANFPVDQLPSGMVLEQGERYNFVGMPGLLNMQPPTQRRNFLHGVYSKDPDAQGRHIAEFTDPTNGEYGLKLTEYFASPEEAHAWVVSKLRNASPATPAQAPVVNPDSNAIPNYDMNDVVNRGNLAESMRSLFSPELRIRAEENQNEPRIRIYSGDDFVAGLRQLEDGRYKAYYNDADARVETEDFDNLQDAVDFLKDGLAFEFPIEQNNEPATPAVPNPAFRTALEVGNQISDPAEVESIQVVRQQVLNRTVSYLPIRQADQTFFDDRDGRRNFVFVRQTDAGSWEVRDGQGAPINPVIGTFADRNTAEMVAMNRIANGGDIANAPATPDDESLASDFRQERLGGKIYTFSTDSNGNINVGDGNGNNLFRIKRESEAPGGGQIDWYVPQDANGNPIPGVGGSGDQNVALERLREYLTNRPAENRVAFPAVADQARTVTPDEVGDISALLDQNGVTRKVDRVGDITQFPDENASDFGSYYVGTDVDGNGNVTYVVKSWPDSRVISVGPDRATAEADAINLITGNTRSDAPEKPEKTPTAPSAQQSDTSIANMTLGGKEITRRRHADGSSEYYNDGDEVGRIERNADGGYDSVDNWSGEVTTFDNEPDALAHQEDLLALYARNGFMDRTPPEDGGDSSGGPSTPPPSGPDGGNGGNGGNPPTPPASPAPVVIDGINRDADGYEIGNPKDAIAKQLGLPPGAEYVPPLTPYGGSQEPGFGYIKTGTGMSTVLTPATKEQARAFGFNGDGNGGAVPNRPRPGDELRPVGPDFVPQDTVILPGANPATPGSQAPGAPQDPSVPQAPEAPNGPEPIQPGRVIPARPQGRPRVNPVQPGERYVKYNAGRDGNYWDIRESRNRRVIGRAATREIADDIALGLRDLNGKLIDYTTPIVPRTRGAGDRFPRPKGYKRTAVGQGYLLENTADPNAPVSRVEYDLDREEWVGSLYANKQDALAKRNPIGSEMSDASQVAMESKANKAVQEELDRRNPPAPAPVAPQAQPAEPQQTQHTRTDFGSKVFAVHDGDNEYGVAKKGQDGKWSVNVFPSPADGNDASKSFFDGSFDTPEEAEAAIRQAIADKRANEQPENILQWQSGSDGKAYIGLDGVPGYDAENSPVWGLSPMPFGAGWFVGAWNKKSDKDAGMPPVGTSRIEGEEEARKFAEDSLQAWLERNPPTA